MPTFRGFVESIEARGDGWIEFVVHAVHAGGERGTFFIRDLDGDQTQTNRRLSKLGLLRDALSSVLPVQLQYTETDNQGNITDDLTVFPRPFFEGRGPGRAVSGTVIGVSVIERGPESSATPYRDESDLAFAEILTDTGSVERVLVDLQRPDALTGHAFLRILQRGFETRRPVELSISTGLAEPKGVDRVRQFEADRIPAGFVLNAGWKFVEPAELTYIVAFLERIGQRYESYDCDNPLYLSHLSVVYTTAPKQYPSGDVSEDGSFVASSGEARVHCDSPLLEVLKAALRDGLQVELGLDEEATIHEVVLVSHLGSAARPIWIEVHRSTHTDTPARLLCDNVPTIRAVDGSQLDEIPRSVDWNGKAYFNEGIWRFVILAANPTSLLVDGEEICPDPPVQPGGTGYYQARRAARTVHAYLNGVHSIAIRVDDHTCAAPFRLHVYRIR